MNDFIEKFASQFYETDPKVFNENTKFKKLDEWNSLTALMIIAMIDEEYNVKISANELQNAEIITIRDLYDLVLSKK